jgi:hypothetical protein
MSVVTVKNYSVPNAFSILDVSRGSAHLNAFFTTSSTLSAPQSVADVEAAVE